VLLRQLFDRLTVVFVRGAIVLHWRHDGGSRISYDVGREFREYLEDRAENDRTAGGSTRGTPNLRTGPEDFSFAGSSGSSRLGALPHAATPLLLTGAPWKGPTGG
jgi:hypothetical protein